MRWTKLYQRKDKYSSRLLVGILISGVKVLSFTLAFPLTAPGSRQLATTAGGVEAIAGKPVLQFYFMRESEMHNEGSCHES